MKNFPYPVLMMARMSITGCLPGSHPFVCATVAGGVHHGTLRPGPDITPGMVNRDTCRMSCTAFDRPGENAIPRAMKFNR
jgi:hypothetical protein